MGWVDAPASGRSRPHGLPGATDTSARVGASESQAHTSARQMGPSGATSPRLAAPLPAEPAEVLGTRLANVRWGCRAASYSSTWICTSVNCIRDAWPGQQGLKACASNLPAAGEISACHLSLTYREKKRPQTAGNCCQDPSACQVTEPRGIKSNLTSERSVDQSPNRTGAL